MRCLLSLCKRIKNPSILDFVILAFLFLLSGCASTEKRPSRTFPFQSPKEIERNIRSYMTSWEGTPHRLGGTDRNGVDCSGFVMLAYNKLFDIQLPRSTAEQIKLGRHISKRKLLAGDIVFFLLPGKKNHVGIYLSKGDFVHVSSSKGVTLSNINESYWRRFYWTARRVLPL